MGRNRAGSNMIEFALTLPIFLVLVFSLMDYGWLFMNKAIADIAVARGCRAGAIVDPLAGNPEVAAMEAMNSWVGVVNEEKCDQQDWCATTLDGEVPTRRIVCKVNLPVSPVVGFGPYPDGVSSYTVTRLEWQRQ